MCVSPFTLSFTFRFDLSCNQHKNNYNNTCISFFFQATNGDVIYNPRAQPSHLLQKSRVNHEESKNNGHIFHMSEVSELWHKTSPQSKVPKLLFMIVLPLTTAKQRVNLVRLPESLIFLAFFACLLSRVILGGGFSRRVFCSLFCLLF